MKNLTSYIDARAVARELLDGAEVAHGYPGEVDRVRRRVTLPDGRVATLAVVFDEDSGIGKWIDAQGNTSEHHDDIFGTFSHRGTNPSYGTQEGRPRSFDGRARVLRPRDNGARIGGPVWWQPPGLDVVADKDLPNLESAVRDYIERGEWYQVGLVVTLEEDGAEVGSASLWGVEWDLPDPDGHHADYLAETVAESLEESGIGKASTAGVARWARDPLEAVARRISGEDPGYSSDSEPAPLYESTLASILEWWREEVEAVGDWDTYGDPLTTRIESDYLQHVSTKKTEEAS